MSFVTTWGGDPNRTGSWWSDPNSYVYTAGLAFPNGNPSLTGGANVYVEDVAVDYASGGSGLVARVRRGGVVTAGGAWIGGSGGTCQLELFHSSGTTYFGRNTAAGGTVVSSASGYTWEGTLCGQMTWSTYPAIPPSLTVTRTGLDVALSWAASSDGGDSLLGYTAQYSLDGGATWIGTTNTAAGTRAHTFAGLPAGASVRFRVYARNGRGSGAARVSGTVTLPTAPGAPGAVSAVRSSRSVALSWSAGATGGEAITGYSLSYSTDGGATWSTPVTTTGTSYTFADLTPGQMYRFRVAAVNIVGTGSPTSSADVFVPAGGRRWNGSAWVSTGIARRWNGSAWVDLTIAKRWNGSAWVDLT